MFATGTPARADVLDELLRRAIALHRQNRYVEAGRLYDEALALSPDLPDALHMRGAVDLSDRGGGNRGGVEIDEQSFQRGVEFRFDGLANRVRGIGGHVSLQLL